MPLRIILLLYRALLTLGSPLVLAYLLLRVRRDRRYAQHLAERFGQLPPRFVRTGCGAVWLHAVSVGEVLSSLTFIRQWRQLHPHAPFYVSVTTVAGRGAAEHRLADLVDGVFYAPFDYAWCVRRVLRALRPAAVIVLETEIWPNLWLEARRSGASLAVLNGRISDKAWPAYLRWRPLFRPILQIPDAILVQTPLDRDRFVLLGAHPDRVHSLGNLKFDFDPASQPLETIQLWLAGARHVLIAASTVALDVDEDEIVLTCYAALQKSIPDLRLILAPRQPARFDAVAAYLTAAQLPFVRRSQLPGQAPILLLDTIGELNSLFGIDSVVFVGGSLARRGGHNLLEPAASGRAILTGPHIENFRAVVSSLQAANALLTVASPAELQTEANRLLLDATARHALGQRALAVAQAARGATSRAVHAIEPIWSRALPLPPPNLVRRLLCTPLAVLWTWGGYWKRKFTERTQLQTPVISVGGITLGGAGKTPVVRWLARELHAHGHRPAILTRGYRRQSRQLAVFPNGAFPAISETGDEAQLFVRDAVADIGIHPDRARVGRALQSQTNPTVFLLDDGFQHARLHRNLDLVILDGTNPFGNGGVFPLGWLREPLPALTRADAFVITRLAPGERHPALEATVQNKPIFYASTQPRQWHGQSVAPLDAFRSQPVAAFCGLADPAPFWQTLRELGYQPAFQAAFPDHHRYTAGDLANLQNEANRAGATVLLTTEKDAVKLPPQFGTVPFYWLEIDLVIDRPASLLDLVLSPITPKPYRVTA